MNKNRQNAITTLTQAAAAIAAMPETERAGWIAYLCEGVESHTDSPADNWLADTIGALTVRLTTGQW